MRKIRSSKTFHTSPSSGTTIYWRLSQSTLPASCGAEIPTSVAMRPSEWGKCCSTHVSAPKRSNMQYYVLLVSLPKTPPPPDPSSPRRSLTRHSTYIPHLLLNDRCPSSLSIPTTMIQENRLFTEWKWFGEDATRMMRGARVYACGRLHRLSSVRHVLGYVQHSASMILSVSATSRDHDTCTLLFKASANMTYSSPSPVAKRAGSGHIFPSPKKVLSCNYR